MYDKANTETEMEKEIIITSGAARVKGKLKDTPLGGKIYNVLPFSVKTRTWGMEIYFEIPVDSPIDKPVNEVENGDMAYWPEGKCLCLFFGPTPMSTGEKPIPASAVEVVGRMAAGYEELEKVKPGEKLSVEPIPAEK